jgi:hypothetical protein
MFKSCPTKLSLVEHRPSYKTQNPHLSTTLCQVSYDASVRLRILRLQGLDKLIRQQLTMETGMLRRCIPSGPLLDSFPFARSIYPICILPN